MWRAGFKWMFLIIGTSIGAGYASGRELWEFFGHESGLAILIFSILFTVSLIVIMKISYQKRSTDYLPVLRVIVGKRFTRIYDIMIFLYLTTITIVMIAGSGATGEAFGLSYWWGVSIIGVALVLLFIKGINGLIVINQLVLPLLITGLLYILLVFISDQNVSLLGDWNKQSNWASAFTFTALNILPLVAVLGAVGNQISSKGEILIASIGSGCILGFVSFIYNSSLIQIADQISFYEMPLFAILRNYPVQLLFFITILLWFAIFTTAAAGVMGIATRIQHLFRIPLWMQVICIVLIMIPLTTIGFSALVSYTYPVYGILNLYVLVRLIFLAVWPNRTEHEV